MKLVLILIFSVAVALFIIGLHQSMTVGLINSYWIFMICLSLLFLYKLLKGKGNNPLS
jgi:hypothetical protein